MKLYYQISLTGSCADKCIDKYIGPNPYNGSGVNIGSLACQSCYNYTGKGIDAGGHYIYCLKTK